MPSHGPRLRRSLFRVAILGAFIVLPVGLLAPVGAAADPVSTHRPAAADDDQGEAATKALNEAEDTLQGGGSVDATLALVEVQQTKHELSNSERERAARLLARPTDDYTRSFEISYDGVKDEAHCTVHFCIHWVAKGKHAPSMTDRDHDGVPNYVETTASAMENVWAVEIGTLDHLRPVSDGARGNPAGKPKKGRVDVYLGDTGANGVYGYAVPEGSGSTSATYLVLDNDFEEFSGPAVAALKVTAAHEFFHAVQFAYSTRGDPWFMESTATWIEERVYDQINDNRQFLPESTAVKPHLPLDGPTNPYANWVFFESLSQAHGAGIIRSAWQQVAARRNSMSAINRALRSHGTNLPDAFSRFASGSNAPELFFDEGDNYTRSRVARSFQLGPSHRSTGMRSLKLDHMSSHNYVFKPGASTTGKDRLRVRVASDAHRVRARLLVEFNDDTVKRRTITFNKSGVGRAGVRFARTAVARVVLTMSNTSFRYRCFQATYLTCQGVARDDNAKMTYRARLRHR